MLLPARLALRRFWSHQIPISRAKTNPITLPLPLHCTLPARLTLVAFLPHPLFPHRTTSGRMGKIRVPTPYATVVVFIKDSLASRVLRRRTSRPYAREEACPLRAFPNFKRQVWNYVAKRRHRPSARRVLPILGLPHQHHLYYPHPSFVPGALGCLASHFCANSMGMLTSLIHSVSALAAISSLIHQLISRILQSFDITCDIRHF